MPIKDKLKEMNITIEITDILYLLCRKAFCVSTLRGKNWDTNIIEANSAVHYKERVLRLRAGQIKECLPHSR